MTAMTNESKKFHFTAGKLEGGNKKNQR